MENIKVYHSKNCLKPSKITEKDVFHTYKYKWMPLERLIQDKMSDLSEELFDQVHSFISECFASWMERKNKVNGGCTPFEYVNSNCGLPTAILLAGVNTPDHQSIYDRIRASVLRQNGHVAIITPGSDTVSSRALITAVVNKLIDSNSTNPRNPSQNATCDSTTNGSDVLEQFPPSIRSTYSALSEWFYAQVENTSDKRKTKPIPSDLDESSNRPPKPLQYRNSLRGRSDQTTQRLNTRRHTTRPTVRRPDDQKKVSQHTTNSKTAVDTLPFVKDTVGPLVIILPQIEAIPTPVLQDFIELTSMYVASDDDQSSPVGNYSLPICLILGCATTAQVGFESRLSASALSRIRAQQFTVPAPAIFLDTVLDTLIDQPGFHLSYPIYTYLIDSLFLCLDYSVNNFVHRIQFCMLEHYLTAAHPSLLLEPEEARQYLLDLSSNELANILSFHYPSISAFIKDDGARVDSPPHPISPRRRRKSSATTAVVDRLVDWLESHWHIHYMLHPLLGWLSQLIAPLSSLPLGKTIPHLYRSWLKSDLFHSEAFSLTINLLHGLSKENFVNTLDRANLILQSKIVLRKNESKLVWPDAITSICVDRLEQFLLSARKWTRTLEEASSTPPPTDSVVSNSPSQSSNTNLSTSSMFDGKRKMSLRGLRQHLQELAAASPKSQPTPKLRLKSAWEKERTLFLDWMQTELVSLIPPHTSLPLHEVFYGPNSTVSTLRTRFNPPLQKCVHQSLIDPSSYLKIPEFKLTSCDSLNSNLPDLCIMYKLYMECGKMINLYDWLMAFCTVLGSDVDKENPPSKLIQARFFQALAQLNYLGYIKSTRRKADHVLRLNLSFDV